MTPLTEAGCEKIDRLFPPESRERVRKLIKLPRRLIPHLFRLYRYNSIGLLSHGMNRSAGEELNTPFFLTIPA